MLKSLTRGEASYAVRLDALDEAVPNEEEPEPVRAERGKVLADYLTAILDAYERAATRKRIVSAIRQAGSLYDVPDPNHPSGSSPTLTPRMRGLSTSTLGSSKALTPFPGPLAGKFGSWI